MFRTDCKKFYKRLRQTYPNVNNSEKNWRTLGEKYMGKKFNIMEGGLNKKPVPTKSKHGMEPNMDKRRCRSTKNNAKLESSWKRPNTKFLA